MTINTPTIKWQTWYDPYGENMGQMEFPGYAEQKDKEKKSSLFTDANANIDELLEQQIEKDMLDQIKSQDNGMKVIATPMGMVPMTEETTPSKIFNFHVGHTNFRITWKIHNVIENSDGVEILDIFTPYRFRIGIGHCFSIGKVKKAVEKNIKESLKPSIGSVFPSITRENEVIWPNKKTT